MPEACQEHARSITFPLEFLTCPRGIITPLIEIFTCLVGINASPLGIITFPIGTIAFPIGTITFLIRIITFPYEKSIGTKTLQKRYPLIFYEKHAKTIPAKKKRYPSHVVDYMS